MSVKGKKVIVTGGSRGLGLGLVEALVAHGAKVTVVAREVDALKSVRTRLGVATVSADITDQNAARRILAEVRPDIVALNAGTKPRMDRPEFCCLCGKILITAITKTFISSSLSPNGQLGCFEFSARVARLRSGERISSYVVYGTDAIT